MKIFFTHIPRVLKYNSMNLYARHSFVKKMYRLCEKFLRNFHCWKTANAMSNQTGPKNMETKMPFRFPIFPYVWYNASEGIDKY